MMVEAQKESAELLKKQLARAADRSLSPQPSITSSNATSELFLSSMSSLRCAPKPADYRPCSRLCIFRFNPFLLSPPSPSARSKDLTKSVVDAYTVVNDKHEKLSDFYKNAYEAEVMARKEMHTDLLAATAVATAKEAEVRGLEVALDEVRKQNVYLAKLSEGLRAEQLEMVNKVMTQLAKW